MSAHFVTIRLEYASDGRTPWKRRGRCTCGWQCLSWDGLRPILTADDHARSASAAPPRFPDHCADHADDPVPPKCGGCQKQKQQNAATARPLTLVGQMRRCVVHDLSFTTVCAGCRSEDIAAG